MVPGITKGGLSRVTECGNKYPNSVLVCKEEKNHKGKHGNKVFEWKD